jgi:type IV pilus assembly protein PilQ
MKYILTIVFAAVSVVCFGQMPDSVREARMQQMRQMMEERQRTQGTQNMPAPRAVAPAVPVTPSPIPTPAAPAAPARLTAVRAKLDTLAVADKNYAREVEEVSVAGLPLAEMLRNIAKVYNVNIIVKGGDNLRITSNLARAKITDLLYFLCKEYNLDVDVVGNIVSIFPAAAPAPAPKVIKVAAGEAAGTISYDLGGERLADVMRLVTSVGGMNFIIPNTLNDKPLSGHGRDMAPDDAIVAISSANGIVARKNANGIWELAADDGAGSYRRQSAFNEDQLFVDSLGLVTAHIARGNVQEIITGLCETQGFNYFFVTPVNHTVELDVHAVTFEALLGVMFAGSDYGYYREEGIWFFGTFSNQTLASVRVIPMQYRSVAKIEEHIPSQLKDGLELKTFNDLNAIIASGDQRRVQRVENFLRSVDKRVPLVTIEVMIMDVTKSVLMEAGLGIGASAPPEGASRRLSPGIDMTIGKQGINRVIDAVNGFGSINLGKVTQDFYANLKMLEEDGKIELHSTPKLSTLNGNTANLKSGETTYYKEIQTNYWGSQTPTPSESYTWKEIEANLEVNITPFVSADGLITLEIEIIQSEFTDRVEADGPMGMATRSFKSTIRVENEDMVLLGGIDRNTKTISSSGLPFISRVPVLKWVFGTSSREKRDHKLNVFIKPTLIE